MIVMKCFMFEPQTLKMFLICAIFFANFSQFLCSDNVLLWQLQRYNVFI